LLALVLMAGLVFVAGCGGGGDTGAGTTQAPSEPDTTEEPGGGMQAPGIQMGGPALQMQTSGGGGMGGMGTPMMGMTGMGGAPGGAGDGGAAGAPPKVTARPPNARLDPFAPWWNSTPPPPPAITLVEPYRIATRETGYRPPEEKVEVQEVPNRRVSGIATGTGVYALVEGPEGQTVVRPGDSLGDYRVEAIRSRSVVLKRKVGNVTYTQEVPLTDVGSQQRTTFVGGVRGGPGGAGMMFRGGRPGSGGDGGPVGAESEM